MPRHVDELQDSEPFPIKPDTNEYAALSFLVSNRDYGFTPTEIADRTDVSEASASKTMTRLFEKGLVERSQGVYYVDPDRADDLQRRLDSIDAAARLHETAPDDDVYTDPGWEDELPSIETGQDPGPNQDQSASTPGTETDTADEATEIVAQHTDDESGTGE